MKMRSGFVSNSSSSSFVIIMTEKQYEDTLKKLDDYQKAVLEALGPEHTKILGQDAVAIQGMCGNVSSFEDMYIEVDDDLDDEDFEKKYGYPKYPQEAFDTIKWPAGVWSGGSDC